MYVNNTRITESSHNMQLSHHFASVLIMRLGNATMLKASVSKHMTPATSLPLHTSMLCNPLLLLRAQPTCVV